LDHVGELVGEQPLTSWRLGLVRAIGEEDILTDGERLSAYSTRRLGRDRVDMNADAIKRHVELELHLAPYIEGQRLPAAGACEGHLHGGIVDVRIATLDGVPVQRRRAALGRAPQRQSCRIRRRRPRGQHRPRGPRGRRIQ
jgi:hypothetical protein